MGMEIGLLAGLGDALTRIGDRAYEKKQLEDKHKQDLEYENEKNKQKLLSDLFPERALADMGLSPEDLQTAIKRWHILHDKKGSGTGGGTKSGSGIILGNTKDERIARTLAEKSRMDQILANEDILNKAPPQKLTGQALGMSTGTSLSDINPEALSNLYTQTPIEAEQQALADLVRGKRATSSNPFVPTGPSDLADLLGVKKPTINSPSPVQGTSQPTGQMKVWLKPNGPAGYIDPKEFDDKIYEKM